MSITPTALMRPERAKQSSLATNDLVYFFAKTKLTNKVLGAAVNSLLIILIDLA